MKAVAYIAVLAFIVSMVILFGWSLFAFRELEHEGKSIVKFVMLLIAGTLLLFAMWAVGQPIGQASGRGFDWIMFQTWFWLPFVAIPIVGQIMALVRSGQLYRGRFSAATLRSQTFGVTKVTRYPAMILQNREGGPGALLFLSIALGAHLTILAALAPDVVDAALSGSLGERLAPYFT